MNAREELIKIIRDEWNLFPKAEVIVSCGIKFDITKLADCILAKLPELGFIQKWCECKLTSMEEKVQQQGKDLGECIFCHKPIRVKE